MIFQIVVFKRHKKQWNWNKIYNILCLFWRIRTFILLSEWCI